MDQLRKELNTLLFDHGLGILNESQYLENNLIVVLAFSIFAARLHLNQLAKNAKGRLLKVHIAIDKQSSLHLCVDQVEIVPLLIILIVSRIDHPDALLNAVCSCGTNFLTLVFQSEENQPKVLLGIKELVKCYNREFFAKFTENKDSTIFLDVFGIRISIVI